MKIKKLLVLASIVYSSCKNELPNKHLNKVDRQNTISTIKSLHSKFLDTLTTKDEFNRMLEGIKSDNACYTIWELKPSPQISSSFQLINKKGKVFFYEKEFTSKNKFPIGIDSIISIQGKELSTDNWFDIETAVHNSYYWNLTNYENENFGTDCSIFIIEGIRDSTYNTTKNFNLFMTSCIRGDLIQFIYKVKNLKTR